MKLHSWRNSVTSINIKRNTDLPTIIYSTTDLFKTRFTFLSPSNRTLQYKWNEIFQDEIQSIDQKMWEIIFTCNLLTKFLRITTLHWKKVLDFALSLFWITSLISTQILWNQNCCILHWIWTFYEKQFFLGESLPWEIGKNLETFWWFRNSWCVIYEWRSPSDALHGGKENVVCFVLL